MTERTNIINELQADVNRIVYLPTDKLRSFAEHPYKVIDNDEMESLVESIKTQGVLTPIVVRPTNDSEYQRFRRIAVATNSTNSDLVRRLLQTSVFVEFPPVEYREIIDQLEHIGINLNQLARVAHSLGFIDEPEYRKNANEVWRMVAQLCRMYLQVGARINDEICKRKGDIV